MNKDEKILLGVAIVAGLVAVAMFTIAFGRYMDEVRGIGG